MKNKLWYLIGVSLKRKIKSKWFVIVNIILMFAIVGLFNIDSIIGFFGGDFNEKQKIYVIDNTNTSFEIFKDSIEKTDINLKNSNSYEVKKYNKSLEDGKKKIKKELYKFKSISVREEAGKRIINDVLPRNDVEVLIDPTMLLTADEWDKVAKKPKQLDNLKNKRYILTYFLGNLSMDKKGKIEEIAQKNNCEIINILDKNSPFYQTGPSEFLYLEKNAILICTDSFHSCVFSILYNRPFLVFQREGNVNKMNSRIETLLNKFKLEDREVNENITDDKLKYDYSQAYKILENERDKTKIFIKNALDIK